MGIKQENLTKLFKEFGKVEDLDNLNPKGVGLGLMISYRLSQNLSGNYRTPLKVESVYGSYTKFIFFVEDSESTNRYHTEDIISSHDLSCAKLNPNISLEFNKYRN